MKYRNIIFDVGGVLLGYQWFVMLEDIGMSREEQKRFGELIFPDPLWLEFDYENIPFEEVVERYVKKFPQYAQALRYFFKYAERMPIWRTDIYQIVHELKKAGYGIYILSNYSSVLIEKHTKGAPFWDDVDGAVFSYMIHEIKPYPPIYRELFEKYAIDPATALFLDDRQANVEGGQALGMDGILIESEEQLKDILQNLLHEVKVQEN